MGVARQQLQTAEIWSWFQRHERLQMQGARGWRVGSTGEEGGSPGPEPNQGGQAVLPREGPPQDPQCQGHARPFTPTCCPNQHEHTRQTQPMPTTTQAGPAPALGPGAQPGETQPYPPGQDDAGSNRKLRPKT